MVSVLKISQKIRHYRFITLNLTTVVRKKYKIHTHIQIPQSGQNVVFGTSRITLDTSPVAFKTFCSSIY